MYDVFLYRLPSSTTSVPDLLIECDASSLEGLRSHLKRYQLRLKTKVTDVSNDFKVLHSWSKAGVDKPRDLFAEQESVATVKDPRHPNFGWRMIASASSGDLFVMEKSAVFCLGRLLMSFCGLGV